MCNDSLPDFEMEHVGLHQVCHFTALNLSLTPLTFKSIGKKNE